MRWGITILPALLVGGWGVGLQACSKSASAESSPDGAAIFASICARCHGPEGKGGPAVSPGQPAPRNLTDPAFQAVRTDAELRAVITNGKGGVMPAFGAVYSAEQIDALVAHVRRLRGK